MLLEIPENIWWMKIGADEPLLRAPVMQQLTIMNPKAKLHNGAHHSQAIQYRLRKAT